MSTQTRQKYLHGKLVFTIFTVLLPIIIFFLLPQFNLTFLHYNLPNFVHLIRNFSGISIYHGIVSYILILLVISPVLEEMAFRGLLQDIVLTKINSYGLTIFLVNFAFMALHYSVNNHLVYMFGIFVCGIIFSIVKIYYKRIIYPIIFHAYYNFCFILYMLRKDYLPHNILGSFKFMFHFAF